MKIITRAPTARCGRLEFEAQGPGEIAELREFRSSEWSRSDSSHGPVDPGLQEDNLDAPSSRESWLSGARVDAARASARPAPAPDLLDLGRRNPRPSCSPAISATTSPSPRRQGHDHPRLLQGPASPRFYALYKMPGAIDDEGAAPPSVSSGPAYRGTRRRRSRVRMWRPGSRPGAADLGRDRPRGARLENADYRVWAPAPATRSSPRGRCGRPSSTPAGRVGTLIAIVDAQPAGPARTDHVRIRGHGPARARRELRLGRAGDRRPRPRGDRSRPIGMCSRPAAPRSLRPREGLRRRRRRRHKENQHGKRLQDPESRRRGVAASGTCG